MRFMEKKGDRLYCDGCDTVVLAEQHGTPLYVYSENDIKSRLTELKSSFTDRYADTRVAYAAKAFFPLAMAKLVHEAGMCVDVVSGGELYTAIKAGFPAEKIEFNGNNKQRNELEMAIKYGIGRIIVDGLQEVQMIEEICKENNKTTKILFRITPGVESNSHGYMVTGKKDSKFGIPMDEDVLMPQIEAALASEYVEFYGFHFHVGSQLFDNTSHLQALQVVLDLVTKTRERFSCDIKELNLGGGFGVRYVDEDAKPFSYFLEPMMTAIEKYCEQMKMKRFNVVIEPGRSIVAEAGITLYKVGAIKEIKGIRKYVSVDGGMTDNIRPALYQAQYTGLLANKAEKAATETVTICGKCCESGDILIRDLALPEAESGDILAVLSTGAYGYTMASNYNKNLIPGIVFADNGNHRVVVKAQTYEDLLRNECE